MASSVSPYEQKLRLVDAFEEHKFYFSKAHFLFLIQESLELTRGGPEKLKYILDLASRCKKSGIVSIELLAKQIDHEYSLTPLLHGQEGGVNGSRGQGCGDMETENGEGGGEEDEEQDDQEEGEAPHANQEVEDLIAEHEIGFFAKNKWETALKTFVVPGEGYWIDEHRIEKFRTSTREDLDLATPKPMPVYINRNPLSHAEPKRKFWTQVKDYHLCRKVAVSFDGMIYRATNAEIEAALQKEKGAPSSDAATYVKAVQEVRRRYPTKARVSGRG